MFNIAQPLFAWVPGPSELIIILLILLLLFGGSKLPSLAKGLGQSIKEFKKASKDEGGQASESEPEKKPESTAKHGSN